MERPTFKRKGDFASDASRKTPKLGDSKPGGKMSFAQKMMAKMGHVEGQGLGKGGEGIVNPIEVKQRPQGAGVGAVKEKTEQYKQEQRRAAAARGEEFEDSSDEERKARKKRRDAAKKGGLSGTSTPGGTRRAKTKYRTVEELTAAAPGLDVPRAMLSSIVDATGSQRKLLTSTVGLMTPNGATTDTEADKIKKRERLELEAFIEAWHGLQERKIYIEEHEGQAQMQLDQQEEDITKMKGILEAVEGLKLTNVEEDLLPEQEKARWEQTVSQLEAIQSDYHHEIESCGLSEAAVAVIHPLFRRAMEDWDPLKSTCIALPYLQRLRRILGMSNDDELATNGGINPEQRTYRQKKTTTPFESLIQTAWLPKLRSTIPRWDAHDPQPMITTVKSWRPFLPAFVLSNVMDQQIMHKLSAALLAWNPRTISKHRHKHSQNGRSNASLPHIWLFPWLPYLSPFHLDPKSPTGLLADVKRKFRVALDTWDLKQGVLPGLAEWRALLGGELDHALVRHLLPRLATHMSANFEIDPADQDITALENVLAWQDFFKADVFGRLLMAEFFPKWLSVLHLWLTTPEVDFAEIGQWLEWWKEQIPAAIVRLPDVEREWSKGLEMMNVAFDIDEQGGDMSQLPPPVSGPARPIAKDPSIRKLDGIAAEPAVQKPGVEETSFKDIVESWCAEEDLTLVPLKEAHIGTGLPLFRITASATGKGGVIVYFKGDIVWAQKKGQRDVFEPAGLEERLVQRAEGK